MSTAITTQEIEGLKITYDKLVVMSMLLDQALEQVVALPEAEQDAIASFIMLSLADENAWKKSFAAKREVTRRLAQEALDEDERGETRPLSDLL